MSCEVNNKTTHAIVYFIHFNVRQALNMLINQNTQNKKTTCARIPHFKHQVMESGTEHARLERFVVKYTV